MNNGFLGAMNTAGLGGGEQDQMNLAKGTYPGKGALSGVMDMIFGFMKPQQATPPSLMNQPMERKQGLVPVDFQ